MPLRLLLALAVLFPAAGCSDDPPPAASAEPIGAPPSVTGADEAAVVVTLTEAQAAELNVETAEVRATSAPIDIEMPGLAVPSPNAFSAVSAPIAGRIVEIAAHEGEPVRRGQTVAVIESLEFANLVSDLMQARAGVTEAQAGVAEAQAEAALQRQQVDRYTALVAERISPQMRLDQARADLARAQAQVQSAGARAQSAGALVRAAQARLGAVGVGQQAADQAARSGRVRVPVTALRGGIIDRHEIDLGGSVSQYQEMMTIVGTGDVLVTGQATPDQAARIRPGDGVSVRSTSDTTVAVAARVEAVAPAASAESRAVPIYVHIPGGRGVRPGQSVTLSVTAAAGAAQLSVPLSAVTYDGDRAVVFVQTGPRTYEARRVSLGAPGTGTVAVLGGLRAGERVVTSRVFEIKALSRAGSEDE